MCPSDLQFRNIKGALGSVFGPKSIVFQCFSLNLRRFHTLSYYILLLTSLYFLVLPSRPSTPRLIFPTAGP